MSQEPKAASYGFYETGFRSYSRSRINDTPDTSQSSGQGFTELGKVYKDPSSGKLIMVEG